jgi:type II secretory pathway component PulK
MELPRGSILIYVLWILAIMSIAAMELAYYSKLSSALSLRIGVRLANIEPARGLIETTVYRMSQEKDYPYSGREVHYDLPKEKWVVKILDEGGKFSINALDASGWTLLLEACGVGIGVKRDTIIDSILDWRDTNSFKRLNGAEDDYYQSLPRPYRCRNGDFQTTEELSLVRGVTPEIYKQLAPALTMWGTGGRLNINSANAGALEALGMSKNDAEEIVSYRRKHGPISSLEDLEGVVPAVSLAKWKDLITLADSGVYRLTASLVRSSGGLMPILTLVVKSEGNSYSILEVNF